MRFIVELDHADDNVKGTVLREGTTEPERFSSWLELLRLLEVPDRPESGPLPAS
jgi:hypothetical protein